MRLVGAAVRPPRAAPAVGGEARGRVAACRAGGDQVPRLLLEVLEVPYTSVFHFAGNLYKPYAPFGQPPIYREGDLVLSQSGTISRHLASKFGIAGDTPVERAVVDMYFELAKDISGKKAGMSTPTTTRTAPGSRASSRRRRRRATARTSSAAS